MTDDRSTNRLGFPANWDVIREEPAAETTSDEAAAEAPATPAILTLLASSWADAVTAAAVCTGGLLVVIGLGHSVSTSTLGWATALGVAWWIAAAAVLVIIRQGTPGMLLAGVVFHDRVPPDRVVVVVAAAAGHALLLGTPGFLGDRRSPLALAAGSRLSSSAV
jgi:hypothetical protein